jgi:hypothetical protein
MLLRWNIHYSDRLEFTRLGYRLVVAASRFAFNERYIYSIKRFSAVKCKLYLPAKLLDSLHLLCRQFASRSLGSFMVSGKRLSRQSL